MKTEKGFSLIELLVAIVIISASALAFLTFSLSGIQNRTAMQRQVTGQTMALDVAERLQKLPVANALVTPDGGLAVQVGQDGSGNLLRCVGANPTGFLGNDGNGMTPLTNPYGSNALYLYDQNTGVPIISPAANANIHHPNANDVSNWATVQQLVAPIRSYGNTTFYAVWTIAYMPCTPTTGTDLAKIFVTVYWIEPEPTDTAPAVVASNIVSGSYRLKTVSVTAEKAFKAEIEAGK